jgi:hypothetical protein
MKPYVFNDFVQGHVGLMDSGKEVKTEEWKLKRSRVEKDAVRIGVSSIEDGRGGFKHRLSGGSICGCGCYCSKLA